MMDRLYVTDLDKTILNDEALLNTRTKEKINLLLKHDVKFTVATARSYNSVREIFHGIDLKYPIIELNGTMLTDYCSESHHVINHLDYSIAEDIAKLGERFYLHPFYTVIDDQEISRLYPPKSLNAGSQWFIDDRIEFKDSRLMQEAVDVQALEGQKVLSLTFINSFRHILKLQEHIKRKSYADQISIDLSDNPYSGDWYWLTVLHKASQKGIAIDQLREAKSEFKNCEVVVFGDNLNDVNMFQHADRGYAVMNAKTELKNVATDIIGYSHEDAVLDFILKENNIHF